METIRPETMFLILWFAVGTTAACWMAWTELRYREKPKTRGDRAFQRLYIVILTLGVLFLGPLGLCFAYVNWLAMSGHANDPIE